MEVNVLNKAMRRRTAALPLALRRRFFLGFSFLSPASPASSSPANRRVSVGARSHGVGDAYMSVGAHTFLPWRTLVLLGVAENLLRPLSFGHCAHSCQLRQNGTDSQLYGCPRAAARPSNKQGVCGTAAQMHGNRHTAVHTGSCPAQVLGHASIAQCYLLFTCSCAAKHTRIAGCCFF